MAFPDGWGRKVELKVQSSKLSGTVTDFALLVGLDCIPTEAVDAGALSALNGGGDLRFSSDSAGTTQLPCEVVKFVTDATAGNRRCEVWVKLSSISHTVDTSFYMWYGNPEASQPDETDTYGKHNVWNSNYIMVYHMAGSSATDLLDSTDNSVDIVGEVGSPSYGQTGQLGGDSSVSFAEATGGTDLVYTANSAVLDEPHTAARISISAYFKLTGTSTNWQRICGRHPSANAAPWSEYAIMTNNTADPNRKFRFEKAATATTNNGAGSTTSLTTGVWYQLCGVFTGTANRLYLNGVADDGGGTSTTAFYQVDEMGFGIGGAYRTLSNNGIDGEIDEVRVSKSNRGSSWNKAEYESYTPGTFILEQTPADTFSRQIYDNVSIVEDVRIKMDANEILHVRTATLDSSATGLNIDVGFNDGRNRLIMFAIAAENVAGDTSTGVTIGGQSMTLVNRANNPDGLGNTSELWYIDDDGLGTLEGSQTVTVSGLTTATNWTSVADLFYNVNQSGFDTSQVEETVTSSTTVSVENISTNDDDLVYYMTSHGVNGSLSTAYTSPLTELSDFEKDNLAHVHGTCYGIETTGQTNKTYTVTYGGGFNRATGIVATWGYVNAVTDLGINISDSITVSENTSVNALNLGDIEISDNITITEDVTVNAIDLGDVSVFDAVSITEDVQVDPVDLGDISIFDAIGITEQTTVDALDLGDISVFDAISIVEDIEAATLLQTDIFDTVSIAENVAVGAMGLSDTQASDDVSVTEFVDVDALDLVIDINDTVTVTEFVDTSVIDIVTLISDTVTVAEDITVGALDLGDISIFDAVSVAEFVDTSVIDLVTSISDTITITEDIEISPQDRAIDISDTITVTEDVTGDLLGNIFPSPSDDITVTEQTTVDALDLGDISIFDAITATEDISVTALDLGDVLVWDQNNVNEFVSVEPLDLGLVSIFDTVSVAEDVTVSALDLVADISDSITVTEFDNALIPAGADVSDLITVTESTAASLEQIDLEPSIWDAVTVAEDTTAETQLAGDVFDEITVTENVETTALDLAVLVNDEITVTENISTSALDMAANVSDEITVTESVDGAASLGVVFIFDTITTTEGVTVAISIPAVISDNVTAAEDVQTSTLDLSDTSTSDSITVSDNVDFAIDVLPSISDSITIAENLGVIVRETGETNIFDTVSIAENIAVSKTIIFPTSQIIRVPSEGRTITVDKECRTIYVPDEQRTININKRGL